MSKLKPLPLNIILLGDPAAGKATQAKLLAKKYKLHDFDMGKELTRRRKVDKSLDRLLRVYNDNGKLTPTAVVRQILDQVIHKTPTQTGILFDGHPKMIGEARLVRKWLRETHRLQPLVVYLSVPLAETVKRISSRKGYFDGKYGKRADDNVTALKNRQDYYRKNVAEVINFFKFEYDFIKVSGVGTISEVENRINKAVDKYSKNLNRLSNSELKRARKRTN